jgi:hypothetical protein
MSLVVRLLKIRRAPGRIRIPRGDALAREISIAHSPDPTTLSCSTRWLLMGMRSGLRFTHTLCDIETLNQRETVTALITSPPSRFMPTPIFRITMLCCRAEAVWATATAP